LFHPSGFDLGRRQLPAVNVSEPVFQGQLSSYGGQAAFPGGSLYHASKWGIEGFCESMMQELAPFSIGVTVVEPGGACTGFRSVGAQLGRKMGSYDGTPAEMVRHILEDTSRLPSGDPAMMARVMIESVDQIPAPKRIALGSDAFTSVCVS
jgi:NAD(P)-dependent dehydrogenase (short-subunit alcohol dehydrogenase family)